MNLIKHARKRIKARMDIVAKRLGYVPESELKSSDFALSVSQSKVRDLEARLEQNYEDIGRRLSAVVNLVEDFRSQGRADRWAYTVTIEYDLIKNIFRELHLTTGNPTFEVVVQGIVREIRSALSGLLGLETGRRTHYYDPPRSSPIQLDEDGKPSPFGPSFRGR